MPGASCARGDLRKKMIVLAGQLVPGWMRRLEELTRSMTAARASPIVRWLRRRAVPYSERRAGRGSRANISERGRNRGHRPAAFQGAWWQVWSIRAAIPRLERGRERSATLTGSRLTRGRQALVPAIGGRKGRRLRANGAADLFAGVWAINSGMGTWAASARAGTARESPSTLRAHNEQGMAFMRRSALWPRPRNRRPP